MKKIILGLAALVSLYAGGLYFSGLNKTLKESAVPTPTETVLGSYEVSEEIVTTDPVNGENVFLIPNFNNPKTSNEIFNENNCKFLVNAGFYTKESKPVGLFKSNEITVRSEHESSLFDGYITVNDLRTIRITRTVPQDNLVIALQSGPILIENGKTISLEIRNDAPDRRVVALVSGDNKVRFLMVRSSTLTNLPMVIADWAKTQKIPVADAINLDGGSASTFRSSAVVIPEIAPIGSAFCVKDVD